MSNFKSYSMEESISPSKVTCIEDEGLDPRVQIELENLNAATDEINKLEATLEEANNGFRSSLNETSIQLQSLSKKLGSCVEKARPYYEAKEKAKQLQLDCQRAAVQYQRANAVHQAARETIALAEERFANLREREKESSKERKFDSAWQEMLNHATMKIMEAEAQKSASEREHQRRAAAYTSAEKEVQDMFRKVKSAVIKSRPYFNHRTATQVKLEAQKNRIYKLQKDVSNAKSKYSLSLRNLEHISEEIHEFRRLNMKREPGVGAEEDQCLAFIEKPPSRECLLETSADDEQEYWNDLKSKLNELNESADPMDLSASPYSTDQEKELNERFSILVHHDDISISYSETEGKYSSIKSNADPNSDSVDTQTSKSRTEIGAVETPADYLKDAGSMIQPTANESATVTNERCSSSEDLDRTKPSSSNFVLNAVNKFEGLLVKVSSLPKEVPRTDSMIPPLPSKENDEGL